MPSRPRRVLLLHPGSLYGGDWAQIRIAKPSLVSLFSYLQYSGVPVEVLDLQVELGNPKVDAVEEYLRRAEELLGQREFDLLAVSCWSSLEYLASVELAGRVRAAEPSVPIVVGGYHPTALPDDFLGTAAPFDVVVRGEGELALVELAKSPSLVAGGRQHVVDGAPLPLDEPIVDFEGYPYESAALQGIDLYLSRGCPYRCAFCMEGAKGSAWRAYPVDKAVALVRRTAALKPRGIILNDACFACRAPWRRAFLKALAEARIDAVYWAQTRADRLAVVDLDLLRPFEVFLQFGVETMSPTMAAIMRKGPDGARYVRLVDETLQAVNDRGLLAKIYLVFNHPGETRETAAETVEWVERFVDSHDHLSLVFNAQSYAFFPGSEVALRRRHFETTYGARVAHPEWWREAGNHHQLAIDIRGSVEMESGTPAVAQVKTLFRRSQPKMSAATQLRLLQFVHQG